MDDVAAVCRNLYISHLEVRWEESIDVRQYVHKRRMRTIVVPLKDRIKEPRARLLEIIDPYLRQLIAANVLKSARGNISRNNLLYDQSRFQERVANGERHPEQSLIVSNFAMCISLYHAMELLERHGLRVFVNNFDADEHGRDKFVLKDVALRELVEHVRQQLGSNPLDFSTHAMTNGQVAPLPASLDFGHPKYEQARQVLLQHFEVSPKFDSKDNSCCYIFPFVLFQSHVDSRAIVFCEYRESVMLIQRLLLQHRPLVRPRCFVGQSSGGSGICALTQKEQLQIMSDFRQGITNVLVATSIGEEGLDVGEVELIVCFDISSSNPTRFVQRIGRTGRQKRGDVVMLVTEGREQQLLKEMLANKDQTIRKLLQSTLVKSALYQHAPRLVPPQFHPRCEQRFMEPAQVKPQPPSPANKVRGKQLKQATVGCQDLRKYFKQSQDRFLQGEPTYKASAASQQLLQEQAARHSVPIKNFLLDTQPGTPAEAAAPANESSSTSSSQELMQRLRKIARLLQATKPLVSDSQRNQDLQAQLQDKQLPAALKLYLLESNVGFVRDIHAKMLEQMQRQLPAARLNSRQQRTRRIYELLQAVCGEHLERLLQPESSGAELTLQDLLQPDDEQQRFEADCVHIFAGLREQGLCADNHELLQQQLEQLELRRLEQTMKEQLGDESTGIYEDWQEQQLAEQDSLLADASVYQSQWANSVQTAEHSSTPLRVKQLPLQDDSRVESSQLSANLSRLNCLMSAASTPLNKKLDKHSLLAELDEDLSTFDELANQQQQQQECQPKAVEAMPEALDIDLNDFLEPLPEEQLLQQQEQQPLVLSAATTPRNLSPDLFSEDSMSPCKPTTTAPAPARSLAAKLAAKSTATVPAEHSPVRTSVPVGQEKSPSIFENYLRRMRGRGQLSKEAQRIHRMTSLATVNEAEAGAAPVQEEDDSPIVRRRPAKRKIYDTFDEEEQEQAKDESKCVLATQLLAEDSFEQVPATQLVSASIPSLVPCPIIPYAQQELVTPPRRKRARFNAFVLQEAEQSGSDHEEDEDAERTYGAYLKDSVIVSSEDEGHNDTTTHAMYLQAMK